MSITRVPLKFEVGHHASAEETPGEWVPAKVPGAVQLDWARAKGWDPYWQRDNWKQYRWMEDAYWTYLAKLPEIKRADGRVFLVLAGVDYAFDVLLDGKVLHTQEGMFTPVRIELTDYRPGAALRVRVHPAPKSVPTPDNRDQANRSCKPAVSYEWDFHPRLIPLGLWQEAYIEVTPKAYLRGFDVRYQLSEKLDAADVELSFSVEGVGDEVRWQIHSPSGEFLREGKGQASYRLVNPELWWPHDHGTPSLYQFTATFGEQTITRRVGFRRVRLVMHDGAWKWPDRFPKGPSNAPITLEVNGRRIFAKGSNFVSPDIFPGVIADETLERMLNLARSSNMNILRMWGGAPAQRERFYELADELGVMIWQEFPLACNNYPDDPAYLRVLESESRSLILRVRKHACVVLFCGGNELFNSWSGMTEQSHALRLIDRNCLELVPELPFLKTSPVMGMGHGHYCFIDLHAKPAEEAWSIFQRSACTAYTEFGMAGAAPVETLRRAKAPEKFEPMIKPGSSRKELAEPLHQQAGTIEHYFGEQHALERWIELSHWLQGEGYRGLFEEARRQKPRASMAINWCFNEPWPNLANLSLIAWPCDPKPSLKVVAKALRPILASARIPKFQWKEGEIFEAQLWLLSDRYTVLPAGEVVATLRCDGAETPLVTWQHPVVPENTNIQGPTIHYRLPAIVGDTIELVLKVNGHAELDSVYRLSFRPAAPSKK